MDDVITSPETSGFDTPASDGGVADAAAALEHQVANPGSTEPAPTGAPAPAGQKPPAQVGQSSWQQQNRAAQESFRQRTTRERREAAQLRSQREISEKQIQESNRLLQVAIDAVKAGRPPEGVEPMPDPYTQGAEFAAWLGRQSEATIQKLIGPISESVQWQRQQIEQQHKQAAQQAQQSEAARAETERYLQWEADYQQAAPTAAHGVRERFGTVRDLLKGAFEDRGHAPQRAEQMGLMLLRAVGADAEAAGENPVAAMDAWGTSLVTRALAGAGVDVEPDTPGDGGDGGYFAGPAAPQLPPQPSEAQRLAAVRQRAGSVGNAGPRAPGRTNPGQSETLALFRSGATVNQLRAAALRESGGDMKRASEILGALA